MSATSSIRTYATLRAVDHTQYGLHAWPLLKKPLPHEIFAVQDAKNRLDFERTLRKTYQNYVKLYHPDVASQHEIHGAKGGVLSAEQKRARFDAIQQAYEILKDPRQRAAYNRAQTTTFEQYQGGASGLFDAYRKANAHRPKYSYENDPKFWQAGTWEDYYNMRYGRPAPTREEWEKNKWSILWKVLAVASIVVTLQIMLALQRTDEFNRQTRLRNLRANADLTAAYDNYQEGFSRFQRIRRFLLYRRLGLPDRDMDGLKLEENDLLTKYAQERVKKIGEPPLAIGPHTDDHGKM